MHEIDELIGQYKFLNNVDEVKAVVKEFTEIKQWDAKIQALASHYPVNLAEMRSEIERAKQAIAENYHTTFDYYLEQINTCESWIAAAERLLADNGT